MDFEHIDVYWMSSSSHLSPFHLGTSYRLSVEKHATDNTVMSSEIFFIDLAGRENERSTRVTGDRLVELSFINRSLMWLSQCIYGLSERRKSRSRERRGSDQGMARFRNSKLTLLLWKALSGFKTSVICAPELSIRAFREAFGAVSDLLKVRIEEIVEG